MDDTADFERVMTTLESGRGLPLDTLRLLMIPLYQVQKVSGGRAQRALVGGTRPRVILLNPNGVMVVCKPEKDNLYYLKYKSKMQDIQQVFHINKVVLGQMFVQLTVNFFPRNGEKFKDVLLFEESGAQNFCNEVARHRVGHAFGLQKRETSLAAEAANLGSSNNRVSLTRSHSGVTENPLAESYAKPSSSVVSSVVSSSALRAAQLSHSNSDSAPAEAAPQTHEAQQLELRAREAALKAALQRKTNSMKMTPANRQLLEKIRSRKEPARNPSLVSLPPPSSLDESILPPPVMVKADTVTSPTTTSLNQLVDLGDTAYAVAAPVTPASASPAPNSVSAQLADEFAFMFDNAGVIPAHPATTSTGDGTTSVFQPPLHGVPPTGTQLGNNPFAAATAPLVPAARPSAGLTDFRGVDPFAPLKI